MTAKLNTDSINSNSGSVSFVNTNVLDVSNNTTGIILPRSPENALPTPLSPSITTDTTNNVLKVFSTAKGWRDVIPTSSALASRKSIGLPRQADLFNLIDANNPNHTTGSGNIIDEYNDIQWSRQNTVFDTIENGVKSFNMDNGYLETGTRLQFGQFYTTFQLWKPRLTDSGWRTVHRNNADHIGLIQSGTVNLGMYSNRNGAFRDSGYDIVRDVWQTWIIVGSGDTETSTTGVTDHYVNGVYVGSSDRVGCGTQTYRYGWPGQGPGKIAVMGSYGLVKLNQAEILSVHNYLISRV